MIRSALPQHRTRAALGCRTETKVKPSSSSYLPVRGLRYHVRTWGDPSAPKVILLHGAQDVSASWQFTVDAMKKDWHFIAPDWRGYGMSQWSGSHSYWQPDLTADLNVLLAHFSPDEPARLMTHSLGGNIVGVYAGLKPERVRLFINVEGYNVPSVTIEDTPKRYTAWLDATAKEDAPPRTYPGYEAFAERMRKGNPRLTPERALFLAQHWCKEAPATVAGGGVMLRSDPAYGRGSPMCYRLDEQSQYWSRVSAPTLWVEGGQSEWLHILLKTGEYARRRACYSNLTVERFEQAGHNVHHEEPERLAELCEAFLLKN